jgi:hypothetical protein
MVGSTGREPIRFAGRWIGEEASMDRDKPEQLPSDDPKIAEEGERNRRQLDEVPEHGADPLHEGP